ncbi:hypothetical protein [Ammoniphilus resinae]|uniref:Uncharacterized protein n=1 Tax=Ammoniphilus resinae TaxID=861532 RepID=A0ABS4GQ18_9BACL|nr:hypothetical protein [Ammoniphilus resinae]MBP1931960.1 hypothetical protein [Ammoniphilus resinae]
MKKTLIIFIGCWLMIGGYLLLKQSPQSNNPEVLNIEAEEPLRWVVGDTKQGNYKPPHWLTDPNLIPYVDEKSHRFEKVEATIPNERLMSFFAQAQLGNAQHISGFINPMIAHEDFTSFEIEDIDKKLEEYALLISKNNTIREVSLSEPKQISDNKVVFDVTIHYEKETISLKDIPMVKMTEDINWFLDMKLSDLVELL